MINRPRWITPEGKILTLSVGMAIKLGDRCNIYQLVDKERRIKKLVGLISAENQKEAIELIDTHAQLVGWKRISEISESEKEAVGVTV